MTSCTRGLRRVSPARVPDPESSSLRSHFLPPSTPTLTQIPVGSPALTSDCSSALSSHTPTGARGQGAVATVDGHRVAVRVVDKCEGCRLDLPFNALARGSIVGLRGSDYPSLSAPDPFQPPVRTTPSQPIFRRTRVHQRRLHFHPLS